MVKMKLLAMELILVIFLTYLNGFSAEEKLSSEEKRMPYAELLKICEENIDHKATPRCSSDRTGFVKIHCNSKYNYKLRRWDYSAKATFTKCPHHQECVCDTADCEASIICQDKDERDPIFPQTGVLQFTGTTGGWDIDGFIVTPWKGKTALDEIGRYYHEYRDYMYPTGWIQRFVIILPENKGYRKITGWFGNKECKVKTINKHNNILFGVYRGRPMRGFKKIFEGEENGKYIQKWKNIYYDDWWHAMNEYDKLTYTFDYNPDTNLAIPVQSNHYFQYSDADRTDLKNYVYSPAVEDESIFDANKYCSKFSE